MVLTQSTMLPLGTSAPKFELTDVVSGDVITLDSFSNSKVLLVMFICRHCPYVVHIQNELSALPNDYKIKDVSMVAISSNDATAYPADGPDSLREFAEQLDLAIPLCYDETQEVAKAYTAACTPDFFLFDQNRKLVYRGQFDDSRPGNDNPITGQDLRNAIADAVAGRPTAEQKPSAGCNIKWRPGNEPSYFG